MNVTCTGCPAKYAVPDERVRGKKVRITCKHCATNIIVDGTTLGAEPSGASKAPQSAKPLAPASTAAPESSYIVGFADDRQETLSVSEIVSQYAAAKLDDDTLVWKDGMPDWLAPFDVPEIASAMLKRGVARRASSALRAGQTDDEPTVVARSPLDLYNAAISGGTKPARQREPAQPAKQAPAPARPAPELTLPASSPEIEKPITEKPVSAAARRVEKRADVVDLFGGVAHAGSETDSSLDLGSPVEEAHKLTGARNESSVLFSLDALTKPDPKAASQEQARAKEQEKEASVLFGDSASNSLLNLGGGGLSALAAPDFSKPYVAPPETQVRPSDPVEVPNFAPVAKKGAGIWVLAVFGIAAAAGGAFFVMQQKNAKKSSVSLTQEPSVAAVAPAPPSTATALPATASAAPEAAAASAEAPAPAEVAAQAITAAGAKPIPATAAQPAAAANKPAPAADAKKPETAAAPSPAPAPATAPAPAAEGAPFDKAAAVSALGAAAASASSCKKPDGPTGSGKVSVTFAPSGRATMTNVGGAFAGTEVGGCVARLFRAAKVPAFSGDPVTVSKSFSIE